MEMKAKQLAAGTVVFEEGDSGDTAFLVAAGVIEISRIMDGEKVVLGEIKAGGLFGEMALINDKPRMATATAKTATTCVLVPRAVYESELGKANAFMKALVMNLIGHVRSLTDKLEAAQAREDPQVAFYFPDDKGNFQRRN